MQRGPTNAQACKAGQKCQRAHNGGSLAKLATRRNIGWAGAVSEGLHATNNATGSEGNGCKVGQAWQGAQVPRE